MGSRTCLNHHTSTSILHPGTTTMPGENAHPHSPPRNRADESHTSPIPPRFAHAPPLSWRGHERIAPTPLSAATTPSGTSPWIARAPIPLGATTIQKPVTQETPRPFVPPTTSPTPHTPLTSLSLPTSPHTHPLPTTYLIRRCRNHERTAANRYGILQPSNNRMIKPARTPLRPVSSRLRE